MINRLSIAEQVANSVQETIADMRLKEGDKLPSQLELAKRLNVSVPTLREGLGRLATMGAIKMVHGVGTIVSSPRGDDLSRLLGPLFTARDENYDEITELFRTLSLSLIESARPGKIDEEDAHNPLMDWSQTVDVSENVDQLSRGIIGFFKALTYRQGNNTVAAISNTVHELILFRARDRGVLGKRAAEIKQAVRFMTLHLESENREGVKRHLARYTSLLADKRESKMNELRFGTGSPGGSFDRFGSRLAAFLSEEGNCSLQCMATGGGIENVDLTNMGRVEFSITQTAIAREAFEGVGAFGAPRKHLRSICLLSPLYLWVVVHEDSSIYAMKDLLGARIATGAVGGNTATVTRSVLEEVGLPIDAYEGFQLSLPNAMSAFQKGLIDCFFYLSHSPFVSLVELQLTTNVRLLPVEIQVNGDWAPDVVWWKPFRNAEAIEVPTIAVPTLLITHDKVPGESVVNMVSSVVDFVESRDGRVDLGEAFRELPVPLHESVVSFLSSRADLT